GMGALPLPLLLLVLCASGHARSAFPAPRTYNLYTDGSAQAHGVRAPSRHRYRTFVKPRYKVVYKSVMETAWRCCHGYSGNDCNIRPLDHHRMEMLEQKVQQLMMKLEKIQTNTNQSERSRNPADHAPSLITQTINNIHSKLDQLDHRTQVHTHTHTLGMASVNNVLLQRIIIIDNKQGQMTLVNNLIKRSQTISVCDVCFQGGVEDVRRQQQEDRDRIGSLEKQLNVVDILGSQTCCQTIDEVKNRITDTEEKISSASATLVVLQDREGSRKRTEENLKEHLSKQLQDMRTVFMDRLQHQAFRIDHLEREIQTGRLREDQQDRTITHLQESLSVLKDCGGQTGEQTGGQTGGQTEKALEWRLVANEDQIRRFYTRLKDLSVSGESLYDKVLDLSQDVQQIKDLRGNHWENLDGEVTEEEPLRLHCDVCVKLEEELQKVRNRSIHALENMKNLIHRIHIRVESTESRTKSCSHLQDEVHLLSNHVSMCMCGRTNGTEPTGDAGPGTGHALEAQKPLEGYSVVAPVSVEQLKVLQGELSEVFFSISSINDSVKLLDDSVQKHGSVVADLGNTNNKIISELDKLQQEVTEQREQSRAQAERTERKEAELRRFEGMVLEELGECVRTSEGLEKRMSHLERVTGRLVGVSESFNTFRHGLERRVTGLNQSVVQHGGVLELLQEQQDHVHVHMKNLNSSLTLVLRELQSNGLPGPSGPPGHQGNVGPRGPPGRTVCGLCGSAGSPGADLQVPRLSFSAALTVPKDQVGTIVFDKVFVNEGEFYDPETGIFTAPVDGHYFFSAVLTGHQHQKIEAVLSKSNYGMARVDSGGYQPEGLENDPMGEARGSPASLAVFSLVLPLQSGETVCIDLVTGNLAHSVEPLTTFNGVLLYELT
uniref:EMILIN-1-like n=1 Tax=Gouania willdenowi TaxID=441366 RepID=A0A8C5H3E5_GOUWI